MIQNKYNMQKIFTINRNKISSRKRKRIPNGKHTRNGRIKHWSETLGQKQFQTIVYMNWKIKKSPTAITIQQRHNPDSIKRTTKFNTFARKSWQKPIDQKNTIKLDQWLDRQFINPIVITVKRIKQSNWH